ncbi:uncharacterized protein LOC127698892 [Mytilus californianus]|uniref:uncharacterized protein LOC127698892 n=1 Tax=Mytilus californianus TaxID=6549 RepID=UPI0022481B95|nr:uncharacterized protein LOC127698892 [Mytilus californianus]
MSNMTSFFVENSTRPSIGEVKAPVDGYDIAVYGIAEGTFYNIHVPALICICISFICALTIIGYSFYHQHYSTFFQWTKSERFVVYMALCDALFNVAHFTDHLHIAVTKTLPRPKSLCAFYGFMLTEFITAQNLMVNIVAINVFILVFYRKHLYFGKCDYRLLVYIFGAPALGGLIAGAFGQLGPNGSFCYFDGVKGKWTGVFFTTVPLLLVLVINTILYILSWLRIYKEAKEIKDSLGKSSRVLRASHKAAKTMSLFVTAFFVQWWAMALYGVWQLVDDVPFLLFNFVTTFSNVGGILNGIVFIIIMRRKREKAEPSTKASDDKVGSGHTATTPMHSIVHSNGHSANVV